MAKDFENNKDNFDDKDQVKEFKEKQLTKERVIYDGLNCAKKIIYPIGTLESEIKPEHKNLIGLGDFK